MTIDEAYRFIQFVSKKDQSGGNPTPDEFNLAIDRAYVEWVKDNIGNKNQYIPQLNAPIVAYERTQVISDDLRHLKKTTEITVDSDGAVPMPTDYMHFSSARNVVIQNCNGKYETYEVPFKMLRDDEIGGKLSSFITAPTKDFPCMTTQDDAFRVYPKTIQSVKLTYLRNPISPVWGYTVTDDYPQYDVSTSTQFESPDHTHNDICIRVLRYLGISIREPQLLNYAQAMEKEEI